MKKFLMKEVKIITNVAMDVVVDVVKEIEEEVVLIHQIMNEQAKTHIPQYGMEDNAT